MEGVDEILVQRVNELYHDLTHDEYSKGHAEIFLHEEKRWKKIGKKFFAQKQRVAVLDIGTGTGFVPLTTARFLKKQDTFTCSDISKEILATAKKNIQKQSPKCTFKYKKIPVKKPLVLPFKDNEFSIVCMNSVLHHVKDTEQFLSEVDRVLKDDGVVIIGHEPSKLFYQSGVMRFANAVTSPKTTAYYALRGSKMESAIKSVYYKLFPKEKAKIYEHEKVTEKINKILLKEKLISKPLIQEEIKQITDIRAEEGFDPFTVFEDYKLLSLETYNHLIDACDDNPSKFTKTVNGALAKMLPNKGSTFTVVKRKSSA